MKKLLCFIFIALFIGCDSENASDCFQRTGDIIKNEIEVPDFSRILVLPNIELVVKQGETTSVVIESGTNLINEVKAEVDGDRLVVSNTNDCNLVRSFNQTKVYVTAPNIREIRSATQFDISSDGILEYPSLRLISEDFLEDNGGNTNGTFTIQLDNDRVSAVGNNIASFFLTGKTKELVVVIASGTGRFDGESLIANDVIIEHRGTNKIIINPQQSLIGEIRSTGDVISVNKPSIIEVEEFFTGKLIFQ